MYFVSDSDTGIYNVNSASPYCIQSTGACQLERPSLLPCYNYSLGRNARRPVLVLVAVPDIPTTKESGLAGFSFSNWVGIFAPKGTPKDIIDKLNSAVGSTLADPSIRERLVDLGVEIPSREQQMPEAFAALQKAEIERWWPIIKAAGIKPE